MFNPLMVTRAVAGFATNFKPDGDIWGFQTEGYHPYGGCASCTLGNGDPTAFNETIVQVDGTDYFHIIVGDPATGFALESYTRAAGLTSGTISSVTTNPASFSPDGGGMETSVITAGYPSFDPTSATTGPHDPTFFQDRSNATNPFGDYRVSGTGTMDPNHTVFRMVLTDPAGDMSLEVVKPFLAQKPRISQTIQDSQGGATMSSVFVTDERALGYNDLSTPAPVVNSLVMNDPSLPGTDAADFEMALVQDSRITAGRYTFTAGSGWNNPDGWDSSTPLSSFGEGTYTYVDGQGFNPLTFDWATVFNYSENETVCTQPPNGGGDSFVRQNRGIYSGSCPGHP